MGLKELLPSQSRNDGPTPVEVDLSAQDVLEEIVNRRRREMLLALEQQRTLSTKDLSMRVWELERSQRGSKPSEHSVYNSVKQNHLPRLVKAGIIVSSDGSIRLTKRGESTVGLVRLLDSMTTEGDQP